MERLHIAFFGPTNSGKSTLVNAIAGQQVSLVSDVPGTTTDPVRKAIEVPGLGPCVLIDTAGLDDTGILGAERERLTLAVLDETDVAVVLPVAQNDVHWKQKRGKNAPNGADFKLLAAQAGIPVIEYTRGESVESLLRRIKEVRPQEEEQFLTGDLVRSGSQVVLVMPQDSEAPKGRLILPQVQVLRELLDRGCTAHCCTPESLQGTLSSLSGMPDLVITDSQVFNYVEKSIPAECPLTSFSILLAAAKGDAAVFLQGARAIASLSPGSRVLIAEACTHVPDTEDIGRVKIPNLLKQYIEKRTQRHQPLAEAVAGACAIAGRSGGVWGSAPVKKAAGGISSSEHFSASGTRYQSSGASDGLQIDIAAGNDFPEDLSPYELIIHCGACVASRQLVRTRTRKALLAGVPITNYGMAIAYLQGILDRVAIPGLRNRRQSS